MQAFASASRSSTMRAAARPATAVRRPAFSRRAPGRAAAVPQVNAAMALETDVAIEHTDVTLQSWELDVLELDQRTFHHFLKSTSDRVVVVDFFTNWCGPCKAMAPFIQELAATMDPRKVLFVKLNCQDNMALAKELQIKALPTFHLYKGTDKLSEITGSKREGLLELINNAVGPAARADA